MEIAKPIKNGICFKKGDIVRIYDGDTVRLAEVKEDVKWNYDYNHWGSVWLVNEYPPLFTHKGGIEKVK